MVFEPFKKRTKPPRVDSDPVPFLRAFDWLANAFTTFRTRPLPGSYSPEVKPTFDLFGGGRIEEVQFAQVLGGLGQLEVLHGKVPSGFARHYLAIQYSHDDPVGLGLGIRPVRVVTDGATFPAVGIADQRRVLADEVQAVRNVSAPPESWVGARAAPTLAAGAQVTLRVLWIEFPVGEYALGIE